MSGMREFDVRAPRRDRVLWPVGWILGLLAIGALLMGTYYVFILTPLGQQADDDALRAAAAYLASRDEARLPAITLLGELPLVCAGIGALALVTAAIVHRSLTAPLVALVGAGGALLTTQLLKHVILERPNLGISEATMNSFPSGHTTLAAASMFAVFAVVTPRWRPLVAVVGALFAAVAGAATVVLGWHRPADIVGAFLVAAWWALVTGWWLNLMAPRWNRWRPHAFWAASPAWSALLWVPGVLAFGAAVGLFFFMPPTDGTDAPDLLFGYLLGGLLALSSAAFLSFAAVNAISQLQSRVRG